jgi:predicted NUDIX family NTP pyrophosphohydrolase
VPKNSAGIVLYRRGGREQGAIEVLLGHPGGPYWSSKDAGAWGVPKGEIDREGEDPLAVARREFEEETGHPAPVGGEIALGDIRKKSGKVVTAWAVEGDLDPATAHSNTFPMEWPPHSGQYIDVPEFDRVAWFTPHEARDKMRGAEWPLVERLVAALEQQQTTS